VQGDAPGNLKTTPTLRPRPQDDATPVSLPNGQPAGHPQSISISKSKSIAKPESESECKRRHDPEPEPVPLFSCLYCVKEHLVFAHMSDCLLYKKYGRPPNCLDWVANLQSGLLLSHLESWAGLNGGSDKVSFGCGNEHDLELAIKPQQLQLQSQSHSHSHSHQHQHQRECGADGERFSLAELQLLCDMGTMTMTMNPSNAETIQPPFLHHSAQPQSNDEPTSCATRMLSLLIAKSRAIFLPRLNGQSRELHWILQKFNIGRRGKPTLVNEQKVTQCYDRSLSSNACWRSAYTRNIQSSKKNEGEQPPLITLSLATNEGNHVFSQQQIGNDSFGMDKDPNRQDTQAETLSFSDSEHDIYSPTFDSDQLSDDSYLKQVGMESEKLRVDKGRVERWLGDLRETSATDETTVGVKSQTYSHGNTFRQDSVQHLPKPASNTLSPSQSWGLGKHETFDCRLREPPNPASTSGLYTSRKASDASAVSVGSLPEGAQKFGATVVVRDPRARPTVRKRGQLPKPDKTRNLHPSLPESKTGYVSKATNNGHDHNLNTRGTKPKPAVPSGLKVSQSIAQFVRAPVSQSSSSKRKVPTAARLSKQGTATVQAIPALNTILSNTMTLHANIHKKRVALLELAQRSLVTKEELGNSPSAKKTWCFDRSLFSPSASLGTARGGQNAPQTLHHNPPPPDGALATHRPKTHKPAVIRLEKKALLLIRAKYGSHATSRDTPDPLISS
jgi:hypothetical protein